MLNIDKLQQTVGRLYFIPKNRNYMTIVFDESKVVLFLKVTDTTINKSINKCKDIIPA